MKTSPDMEPGRLLFKAGVAENFPDFLRDESRRLGHAETISFPMTEDDIRHVLSSGVPVTTQGSRTGITGGAVPDGGHILNLSRMNRVTGFRRDLLSDAYTVSVQPGVTLAELRRNLQACEFNVDGWSDDSKKALDLYRRGKPYFFPPDPTETTASIGGMVACNASGACTFHYGATRVYVDALRVVLAGGDVLVLRRGRHKATGRAFVLRSESGRELRGCLPDYPMPAVKNAAGFFAGDNLDMTDLFIGAEGTLGVFSEIELRIIPQPACRWAVMVFLPSEASAIEFVKLVRALPATRRPVAVEYFDCHALGLLRLQRMRNPSDSAIPAIPIEYHTAVYVEYHGDEVRLAECLEGIPVLMRAAGGDDSATWVADSDHELERFKRFRHAVPEAVNSLIDERRKNEPCLTKLGTDMAVPDNRLSEIMDVYRVGLAEANVEYVMFGHIGNNHLHVNLLPRSLSDYERGKDLYLRWAAKVVEMGGTVSAEHGIGKFKVALLRAMYGEPGVRQMREVKRVFDPDSLLNRGNLF